MRSNIPLVGFIVLTTGCGGGNGGNGNVRPDEPPPAEPIVTSRTTVQGTTATDLVTYLKDHASGGPWGPEGDMWTRHPQLPLWEGQPIVRVQVGTSDKRAQMVELAVDLLNDWLPLEHRMIMGSPTTFRASAPNYRADVPAGELHVSFDAESPGGRSHYNESGDFRRTDDVPRMISNWVEINGAQYERPGDHGLFGVIVHELYHALGMPGHVPLEDYPETILPDDGLRLPDEHTLMEIARIDGEGLMTAYTLYDNGETSDEINMESLGSWASTIPALTGTVRIEGVNARFGAEYREQWTRVWDSGPMPTVPLTDALTGSATWIGAIIGFTDAGLEATGGADITVALETLTGTAAFTDIMAGGIAWGPDISTGIGVIDNYFAADGSEPRLDVQGQFRGTGHQAATGVLRWEDTATGNLTGAFGVVREAP